MTSKAHTNITTAVIGKALLLKIFEGIESEITSLKEVKVMLLC
jgi:hypothetical protein